MLVSSGMAGCVAWGLGVAALTTGLVTWSTDANACSCAAGVYLVWPPEGAAAVALDTRIVVGGEVEAAMFKDADAAPLVGDSGVGFDATDKLLLVSEGDEPLGLTRERSFTASACVQELHFAEPQTELKGNSHYELRYGTELVGAFTTGAVRRNVEAERAAAERLSFEVLGSSADPSRITTAFVTNVAQQQLYLNYTGSVTETTIALHVPRSEPIQLNFGELVCPEVRVLGTDGRLLTSRLLCDAQRCLESGGEFVQTSCGGNYAVDIDYESFRALPVGCPGQDPPSGELDSPGSLPSGEVADAGVNQHEPQKVAVRNERRGCAVGAASGGGSGIAPFALAVAVWRRRRMPRRRSPRTS